MAARKIGPQGLSLIKAFEGLRLHAYRDIVGILTIGFGSTGAHVKAAMTITEAEAEKLLLDDLKRFEQAVAQAAPNANQNQFDAMVSLAFNIGTSAFQNSTLLRKWRAGDIAGAKAEFLRWNKAGGKTIAGLTRRRAAEAALFGKAL